MLDINLIRNQPDLIKQAVTNRQNPELTTTVTYPGPFVRASAVPVTQRRLPPKVGEHNAEVYLDELGLTRQEFVRLYEAGVL